MPARDRLVIHRSLSESQLQHVRQSKNPWNFVRSFGNPDCCGWDTRAPFHLCNTPRTLPPLHDAASAWNAGFIRQVCNRRVLLPDKSGVPVVVSRACCPNGRAGLSSCRLRSFPTSRTKADSLIRNPGTGKSPEPADRNVCPTSKAESDLGNTPRTPAPRQMDQAAGSRADWQAKRPAAS